jgi:hypothetical protein
VTLNSCVSKERGRISLHVTEDSFVVKSWLHVLVAEDSCVLQGPGHIRMFTYAWESCVFAWLFRRRKSAMSVKLECLFTRYMRSVQCAECSRDWDSCHFTGLRIAVTLQLKKTLNWALLCFYGTGKSCVFSGPGQLYRHGTEDRWFSRD